MASIGEVVTRLRAVLTSCGAGSAHLRHVDAYLRESLQTLTQALAGAGDDEPVRLLRLALVAVTDALHAVAQGVQQHANDTATYQGGAKPPWRR